MTKAADDYETIRRRMEELKAERDLALTGSSVPQAEEQKEPPSWGYGSVDYSAMKHLAEQVIANSANGGLYGSMKSLAHPAWPYAGTGFEWRKFVRS